MPKKIDLSGEVFNKLTVLSRASSIRKWLCRCECGKELIVPYSSLHRGSRKSCGCHRIGEKRNVNRSINLTGKVFGKLIVKGRVGLNISGSALWSCLCCCGKEAITSGTNLRSGKTTSCGCWQIESLKVQRKKREKPVEAAINCIKDKYKRSAENRALVFSLEDEEFKQLILDNCHYCGALPSNNKITPTGGVIYNGIDRLDNSVGYTIQNCVSCCTEHNMMKKTMTQEQFLASIHSIAKHQGWLK